MEETEAVMCSLNLANLKIKHIPVAELAMVWLWLINHKQSSTLLCRKKPEGNLLVLYCEMYVAIKSSDY